MNLRYSSSSLETSFSFSEYSFLYSCAVVSRKMVKTAWMVFRFSEISYKKHKLSKCSYRCSMATCALEGKGRTGFLIMKMDVNPKMDLN